MRTGKRTRRRGTMAGGTPHGRLGKASAHSGSTGWLRCRFNTSSKRRARSPMLVLHGSPRKTYEGLNPHDGDEKILDILAGTPYPVVISGHTHRAMNRRVNGYHVINAGSVGAPFDRAGRSTLCSTGMGRHGR